MKPKEAMQDHVIRPCRPDTEDASVSACRNKITSGQKDDVAHKPSRLRFVATVDGIGDQGPDGRTV